jgi:hypothetical protein
VDEKNTLDEKASNTIIEAKVDQMNAAIKQYTDQAGISPNPQSNPDYKTANEIYLDIQTLQQNYSNLNKNVVTAIREITSGDIKNKLVEIGSLQNDIKKLESELSNTKQDSDTSKSRQNSVETPRQELSWYQGFGGMIGFTKPIYKTSISFFIGFGLLLLFLSALILREFFVPVSEVVSFNETEGLFSVFTDSRFIAVLGGMILVFVTLIVLTLRGRLGKNVR